MKLRPFALALPLVALLVVLVTVVGSPSRAEGEKPGGTGVKGGARAAQVAAPDCPPPGLNTVPGGQLRMPSPSSGAKPGSMRLLIAIMSGGDGDADDYLKLGATANRQGIAVLYPTGRAGSLWQLNDAMGTSDVQLVTGLMDRTLNTGCFDINRVSIVGVSNGGGFATRMACKLPMRFAAVVAVAAGYRALDACPRIARASFLAIHGSRDPIVPFYGKLPDRKGNVPAYAGRWARRDGCSTRIATIRPRRFVTRYSYEACPSQMRVEVLLLSGTDHGWPGAAPPWPKANPSGVDGNLEVVRFIRHATRIQR